MLLKNYLPALQFGAKIQPHEVIGLGGQFLRRNAKAWYVDGSNGNDSDTGEDPNNAFATVQAAVTAAGEYDVIYIFPKAIVDGTDTDPNYYNEAISIPITKQGIALIGVSHSPLYPYAVGIKGSTAASPIIDCSAPFVTISGLCFNRGSTTTGGIRFNDDGGSTQLNIGNSVVGCYFRNLRGAGDGSSGAAVSFDGGVHGVISGNAFFNCRGSIIIKSATSAVQDVVVSENTFLGDKASLDTDIYIHSEQATGNKIAINHNYFDHEVPTYTGGLTAFIYWTGTTASTTCVGSIQDNYFGATDVVIAAAATDHVYVQDTTNVSWAGNYDREGLIAGATS